MPHHSPFGTWSQILQMFTLTIITNLLFCQERVVWEKFLGEEYKTLTTGKLLNLYLFDETHKMEPQIAEKLEERMYFLYLSTWSGDGLLIVENWCWFLYPAPSSVKDLYYDLFYFIHLDFRIFKQQAQLSWGRFQVEVFSGYGY